MPAPRKVGFYTKLTYGFGSIAYGIKDNGFTTFLLLFYNQVIGLPADQVGLVILAALVLDAFIDPVIGHFSDHLRSPWGRRHPFMYLSAIPIGISFYLLWHPPITDDTTTQLWYLFFTAIATRAAISCYEVPSAALAPELTQDYHDRTSVLGFRHMFGWFGGLAMSFAAFMVFFKATPEYPMGQLNPEAYKTYSVVASVLMTVVILISAIGTHHCIKRLSKAPRRTSTTIIDTFKGILGTLKNKAFLVLVVASIFSLTNQGLMFALSTYLNTYVWLFSAEVIALLAFGIMGGVIVAMFIAGFFSRRFGKKLTTISFGLLFIVLSSIPYLLYYFDMFLKPGDPRLLPILMVYQLVVVSFAVGSAILGASMMSDVVEDSQMKTGKRSEGLFFAGSFFVQKCVSGVGLYLSGFILSMVNFPERAVPGQVDQVVLDNFMLTFVGVTTVLGIISALVICFYPISEADHEARIKQLQARAANSGESQAVS